jgi:hypothetical protein
LFVRDGRDDLEAAMEPSVAATVNPSGRGVVDAGKALVGPREDPSADALGLEQPISRFDEGVVTRVTDEADRRMISSDTRCSVKRIEVY